MSQSMTQMKTAPTPAAEPESLFINGEWGSAIDGETRTITCPANNQAVGVVAEASTNDTDRAIAAAREAFDSGVWSGWSGFDRGQLLLTVADGIEAVSYTHL